MEKEVNQTPNLANNPNKSKQTASKKREEKKILRPMFKPYNLGTNPNEFGRITPKRRAEKRKKKTQKYWKTQGWKEKKRGHRPWQTIKSNEIFFKPTKLGTNEKTQPENANQKIKVRQK